MTVSLDQQPRQRLNTGYSIPLVGLGTWKSQPGEVKAAVEAAVRLGYRHIDCAEIYKNEHEVGEALAKVFAEGVVKREELFITSKLWNSDHDPERVEAACRKSLQSLKLDYLDLYLIHWPSSSRPGPTLEPPYAATWTAMEALADKGLVRSIGVSNVSIVKLAALLKECRIKPAVNQVEIHPYLRNDALIKYCSEQGIHVTAYSPLGSPDSASMMGRKPGPLLMEEPVVLGVAKKLGKSPAQVLIRWALQRGTSVLPKSVNPERLQQNLDVFDWSLPEEDFAALSSLPHQSRMVPGTFLVHPDGPYKSVQDLWDDDVPGVRRSMEDPDIVRATSEGPQTPPPTREPSHRPGGGAVVKVFDSSGQPDASAQDVASLRRELERALRLPREVVSDAHRTYAFLDRQPYYRLNNGWSIPAVGLGTWKSERGQVKAAVEHAIRAGYRHIDCAFVYENEHEVGEALATIFSEGVVPREDLFITSKLWNTFHSPAAVKGACQATLQDLGLSYLDLYLIHWPVTGNRGPTLEPPLSATWAAMEALMDAGLVRSIGCSNLSSSKLRELLKSCRIKPAVNQVEVHPFFRNDALIKHCKEQGIHVTAYAPLGSPDSASVIKRKYSPSLLKHPVVLELAQKYGKDVGQVLIRWALQHGTSVLPKSVHPERIVSNLDVMDWALEGQDYQRLCSFDLQVRMVDGSFWLTPEGPYRRLSELWDDPAEDQREAELVRSTYRNLGGVINGVPMPTVKLSSGFSLPMIGLGTWKSEPGEVKAAVEAAIRMGYRHIDCAEVYKNEHEVGEALAAIFAEGVVKREELFITSKLWNTDHEPQRVEAACRRTLHNLRLSYLDLYLIHWPATGRPGPMLEPPYLATWTAMEALADPTLSESLTQRTESLVRSIGVSNVSATKIGHLLQWCRIKPAINQVECHPYFRNDALLRYCGSQGIHVTAYSPLGSPDSASMLGRKPGPLLMQEPVVLEMAKKLGKSPAQVLIRWALQRGTSVLPKSVNPERLASNLDVLSWSLPQEDFAALSSLPHQSRMVQGTFLLHPSGPYKTLRDLWDEDEA